jgi:cell wall-associated NlpC family hydrolase
MKWRFLLAALISICAPVSFLAQTQQSCPANFPSSAICSIDDTFQPLSGTVTYLNERLWRFENDNPLGIVLFTPVGPTGLRITAPPGVPSGTAGRGIFSVCSSGTSDFDVQVDYTFIGTLFPYEVRLGAIELGTGPFGEVGIHRNSSPSGGGSYTMVFPGSTSPLSTADTSGTLRLQRSCTATGCTLQGYKRNASDSDWVPVGPPQAIGSDATQFNLDVAITNSTATGDLTASFANFKFAGTIQCPSVAAQAALNAQKVLGANGCKSFPCATTTPYALGGEGFTRADDARTAGLMTGPPTCVDKPEGCNHYVGGRDLPLEDVAHNYWFHDCEHKLSANIVSAVRANNIVTITTTAENNFVLTDQVTISGVVDTSFDGTFTIKTVPSSTTFTYAQIGSGATSGGGMATVCPLTFAPGIDCSGLVLWSYNTAAGATTKFQDANPIQYRTADAQYMYNVDPKPLEAQDLEPGDLLFFNYGEGTVPTRAEHVAMYVGDSQTVEAYDENEGVVPFACNPADGCERSRSDPAKLIATSGTPIYGVSFKFLGFRRPLQFPFVAAKFQTHSPVSLVVTDPDGFVIDANTTIFTSREVLHEVPGQLYYLVDSSDGSTDNDTVIAPRLKTGDYLVKVVPKPGTSPNQNYSLTVQTATGITTLADAVPIANIPSEGYGITSTGIGGTVIPFVPVAIDIKPGTSSNPINPWSNGTIPVAILSSNTFDVLSQIDVDSLTFGRTGNESSLAACAGGEDVNGDGLSDMVCHFYIQQSGFVSGDTRGILRGLTLGGEHIRGTDSVRIVP